MKRNTLFPLAALCASLLLILACTVVSAPATEQSDPSAVQTEIAFGIMATNLANQKMTLEALQSQMTVQVTDPNPTASLLATQTGYPTREPTQVIQQASPLPEASDTPPPASLVLEIRASVDTFYCYQSPYEVTFSVRVSDINRGMAVYYHIRDKSSGVRSDGQVVDLHRKTGDTRTATVIGGGSNKQNLQFPPGMGESYFVYQIISDNGTFRSPVYSDITFFPCAQ